MEANFLITSIKKVIMIDRMEFPERKTIFSDDLSTNELIFHFSGKSTIYFNDKIFDIKENTIRYLPKSKVKTYIADREKHGMCDDKYKLIKPAIDYIQANIIQKLPSAEELVELCGISYPYIHKLFMQKYAMSPQAYSLHLKMNYAGELLSSGMYNATQVATMCGYENISFFYRQFKKYYNLTPVQYIKNTKVQKYEHIVYPQFSVNEIIKQSATLVHLTTSLSSIGFNMNCFFMHRQMKLMKFQFAP